MNAERHEFLRTLHQAGVEHDARETDRTARYRNLDPDTGHFIHIQIELMSAQTVVEVGTSNGYSTVWFADAVEQTGGRLISVDINSQEDAIRNIEQTGLSASVEFVQADAGDCLRGLADNSVDLLFLDAERTQYVDWWPHPHRVLRPGGLMLIDNAHHPAPDELVGFVELINAEPGLDHLTLMVGSGLILARKSNSANR